MALRLTSKLRVRLARASEALLTPPEHGRLPAWRDEVRAAVAALLRADAVALRLPPDILPPDPGEEVPPALDRGFRAAAEQSARAIALGRVPPHGAYMAALITPRPRNVAGLLWSRRLSDARAADTEMEVLRLLYPAFKAGVAACLELALRRPLLCAALDGLAEGAALLDGRGRVLHRNQALREIVAADPDAGRVMAAADALVRELRGQSLRGHGAHAVATRAADIETAVARYRLFGTLLETGAAGPGSSILLVVEPRSPRLPPAASLRRRFGLSRREAEVALLLAQGRRNSNVAESLGISPHTARHHTEMVLAKLGSRSRAEVGAVLLRA